MSGLLQKAKAGVLKASRASPSATCDVEIANSSEMLLHRLGKVIRDNYFAFSVWAVITLSCAVIVIFIVRKIINSVRVYKSRIASKKLQQMPPKPQDDVDDNVLYASEENELPAEPESVRIKESINRIRDRYAAYNRAISTYVRGKGKEPDDVIDKRIMSRADDDTTKDA